MSGEEGARRRDVALIATLCVAEIASMSAIATFPALLPTFIDEWQLTHVAAGWISSLYFAGYLTAVLILVSLTDSIDPRRIYLFCMLLSLGATAGFALFAQGFWTASALRVAGGIALAGTYMPGLKILSDRIAGQTQARAVSFYTASFGIGSSASYYLAGQVAAWRDWHWAFGVAAIGPLLATLLVWRRVAPSPQARAGGGGLRLRDFLDVLRNRSAMGYILAYAAHNWELFGMRAWIVAYLTFARGLHPASWALAAPPTLAALVNLMGLPASVGGNELSIRCGRQRVISAVMGASALLAAAVGFLPWLPGSAVAAMCLVYGLTVAGDSASLTSGAIAEARPDKRGTTMAVHSAIGFLGAFCGPLAVGAALDVAGGAGGPSWGAGFLTMGAGAAVGPLLMLAFARR
ncbi:MAG: MFS transporter [Candidatus Lambdaproteobacteria bacterium]|nr:MFS transporter [Candidatus Lambdaproteobacteria bacterium]